MLLPMAASQHSRRLSDGIEITLQDISVSSGGLIPFQLPSGFCPASRKMILNGITGVFHPGQLIAVMVSNYWSPQLSSMLVLFPQASL